MKSKTVKGVLLVCLVALLFACNSQETKNEATSAVVIDKEQVKQEIQAREDEFAAVYNSGEPKSIGYYADDAVSFFQNRPPLVGKPAIIEFLLADINENSNTIIFKTNEVFVSNDGVQVVELGNYRILDSTKTTINTGNYMSLFEKRNGKYVCLRDMSASIMPLE